MRAAASEAVRRQLERVPTGEGASWREGQLERVPTGQGASELERAPTMLRLGREGAAQYSRSICECCAYINASPVGRNDPKKRLLRSAKGLAEKFNRVRESRIGRDA